MLPGLFREIFQMSKTWHVEDKFGLKYYFFQHEIPRSQHNEFVLVCRLKGKMRSLKNALLGRGENRTQVLLHQSRISTQSFWFD